MTAPAKPRAKQTPAASGGKGGSQRAPRSVGMGGHLIGHTTVTAVTVVSYVATVATGAAAGIGLVVAAAVGAAAVGLRRSARSRRQQPGGAAHPNGPGGRRPSPFGARHGGPGSHRPGSSRPGGGSSRFARPGSNRTGSPNSRVPGSGPAGRLASRVPGLSRLTGERGKPGDRRNGRSPRVPGTGSAASGAPGSSRRAGDHSGDGKSRSRMPGMGRFRPGGKNGPGSGSSSRGTGGNAPGGKSPTSGSRNSSSGGTGIRSRLPSWLGGKSTGNSSSGGNGPGGGNSSNRGTKSTGSGPKNPFAAGGILRPGTRNPRTGNGPGRQNTTEGRRGGGLAPEPKPSNPDTNRPNDRSTNRPDKGADPKGNDMSKPSVNSNGGNHSGPSVASGGGRSSGTGHKGNISAAAEAYVTAMKKPDATTANSKQRYLEDLANAEEIIADAKSKVVAKKVGDEWGDTGTAEALSKQSNAGRNMAASIRNTLSGFRRKNKDALERIDNPGKGHSRHGFDVSKNEE